MSLTVKYKWTGCLVVCSYAFLYCFILFYITLKCFIILDGLSFRLLKHDYNCTDQITYQCIYLMILFLLVVSITLELIEKIECSRKRCSVKGDA